MDAHRSPWFYFRDDLDLLEEKVDAIFLRHEGGKMDTVTHAMEDEVIEEQMQSEEANDELWEEAVGAHDLVASHHDHLTCWLDDTRPIRDMLHDGHGRDPLYLRARRWADALFAWSGHTYEHLRHKDRDLFRLRVNVCLVPAKIALAREEEQGEDPLAWELAGREFTLALLYLDRSLESFRAFLHRRGALWHRARGHLVEGAELRCLIERQRAEVERRRRFHSRRA